MSIFDAAVEVAAFLEDKQIPYAVLGGLALQHWGDPRTTQDVDIVVMVSSEKEEKFLKTMLRRFRPRMADALSFSPTLPTRVTITSNDCRSFFHLSPSSFILCEVLMTPPEPKKRKIGFITPILRLPILCGNFYGSRSPVRIARNLNYKKKLRFFESLRDRATLPCSFHWQPTEEKFLRKPFFAAKVLDNVCSGRLLFGMSC